MKSYRISVRSLNNHNENGFIRQSVVPWEMSYYNGKVTVTGYVVNNRIFKLKTYKVKVGVGVDNKIYASTTKTYKNVKDSTIKKVTFSFKSKKALDFVNNSPTWSVRTLKSVW